MKLVKICFIATGLLFSTLLFAEEIEINEKNTEYSIYTGMFDFSDDGKRSTLIGFQHQNEDLN